MARPPTPAKGSQINNVRASGGLTWDVKSQKPQVNSLRALTSKTPYGSVWPVGLR